MVSSLMPKGVERYKDWYESREDPQDKRIAGFAERKQDHILKVAMLLQIAKQDELVIDEKAINGAMAAVDVIDKLMPDAFSYIGTPKYVISERIIDILSASDNKLQFHDLLRTLRPYLRDSKPFVDILQNLIDQGTVSYNVGNSGRWVVLNEKCDPTKSNK